MVIHTSRSCLLLLIAVLWIAVVPFALAQEPKVGDPPQASNMRLIGFNDLQERSAYQPTIHHQGNRYIAYIGHHGSSYVPNPWNKLTNRGDQAARILMWSSSREPAVAVYPDSDKIGVWPGDDRDELMLRRADGAVPYYDGEV